MPNSFRRPARPDSPSPHALRRLRSAALCLLAGISALALLAAPVAAQTLARPGWVGSGLNADPWWKQAVFYEIRPDPLPGQWAPDAPADFKQVAARLDSLKTIGVDALILSVPSTSPGSTGPLPDGPALQDFDDLLHQASRLGLRILIDLVATHPSPDLPATAQFWLSHGVAGFHLLTPPAISPLETQSIIQTLRRVTDAAVGQRIVIANLNPNPGSSAPSPVAATPRRSRRTGRSRSSSQTAPANPSSTSAQLQVDTRLSTLELPEAANLRSGILRSLGESGTLLEIHPPATQPAMPDPYPALARPLAAILLATHPAAILRGEDEAASSPDPTPKPMPEPAATAPKASPDEVPPSSGILPGSLADWYRQLSALHHDNPAVRYGTPAMLDFDDQNALVWVDRPANNAGLAVPVVFVCNLSSSTVQLALGTALRGINLRGSYLRTLLRSDKAMGPQDLNAVTLPPFSVYIGELHR